MNKIILFVILLLIAASLCLAVWLFNSGPPEIEDLRRFTPLDDHLPDLIPGNTQPESSDERMKREAVEPAATTEESSQAHAFSGRVLDLSDHPIAGARVIRGTDRFAMEMVNQGGLQGVTHFSVGTGGSYTILRDGRANSVLTSAPGFTAPLDQDPRWCTLTDEQGRFTFTGIPLESDPIFLYPPSHPDFVATEHFSLVARNEEPVLRMRELACCALKIEAKDGTSALPVSEFSVHLVAIETQEDGKKRTWLNRTEEGSNGFLHLEELRFVEGCPLKVTAHATGQLHRDMSEADRASRTRELTPVPGETHSLRFSLLLDQPEREAGANVVSGVVLDAATGEPVPGAKVWSGESSIRVDKSTTRASRRVLTNPLGRFCIARPPEAPEGKLGVDHPQYDLKIANYREGEEVEIKLLRRPSLKGVLVDKAHNPLPRVPLLFLRTGKFMSRNKNDGYEKVRRRIFTDKDGRFLFDKLQSGTYTIFVLRNEKHADEQALTHTSYDLAPGEEREVVLMIEPPETIELTGFVHPPHPLPCALLPIFVGETPESGWVQAVLERDGSYRAGGLVQGTYLVLLLPAHDDFKGPYALLPPVTMEGFGDRILDFTLPTSVVRGKVSGLDSVEAVRVVALPQGKFQGQAAALLESPKLIRLVGAQPDELGYFEITHVAPGPLRLEIRKDSKVLASRDVLFEGSLQELGEWSIGD